MMSDFLNFNIFFNLSENSVRESTFDNIIFVSTFNRTDYLSNFIRTLIQTIDLSQNNLLIIGNNNLADFEEIIKIIQKYKVNLPIVIQNNIIKGVAYQLAQCINFIKKNLIQFNILFCCDNDIIFKKKGWIDLYQKQIKLTKYEHLCYFSINQFMSSNKALFKPAANTLDGLRYLFSTKSCQGCFFTITPDIIKNIGFPDYFNFPVRGDWHEDYSLRCCRNNYNIFDTFFDANNSDEYIDLLVDNYITSIPLNKYKFIYDKSEINRRRKIKYNEERIYVKNKNFKIIPIKYDYDKINTNLGLQDYVENEKYKDLLFLDDNLLFVYQYFNISTESHIFDIFINSIRLFFENIILKKLNCKLLIVIFGKEDFEVDEKIKKHCDNIFIITTKIIGKENYDKKLVTLINNIFI